MTEPLIRGFCPVCNKQIIDKKKTAYINGGMEFLVHFTDGTKANFAICQDCFAVLTKEQVDVIVERQKINWGLEIHKQLEWYVKEAVNLKAGSYGLKA